MYYYVSCCCPSPYYFYVPTMNFGIQPYYGGYWNTGSSMPLSRAKKPINIKDYGPEPYVVDIEDATKQNNTYRTAIWTGKHLQVTLMSLKAGEDIGLEIHPHVDQFLRIEQGKGIVRMGKTRDNLNIERKVEDDSAIMVPAGTWHNVINTGRTPLKLYSIYAPPQHPRGTVHRTKAEAMKEGT